MTSLYADYKMPTSLEVLIKQHKKYQSSLINKASNYLASLGGKLNELLEDNFQT
jgi:hypothetical protein